MAHDYILGFGPIVNGKVLDINMVRVFSGETVIDHIDRRHLVFLKWCGTILWLSNFQEDSMQVFSVFGYCNSSKKLGFSARGTSGGLSFRAI